MTFKRFLKSKKKAAFAALEEMGVKPNIISRVKREYLRLNGEEIYINYPEYNFGGSVEIYYGGFRKCKIWLELNEPDQSSLEDWEVVLLDEDNGHWVVYDGC